MRATLKRIAVWTMVVSLGLPTQAVAAEAKPDAMTTGATPDSEAIATVTKVLGTENSVLNRLEALEARTRKDADSIERLSTQLARQIEAIEASNRMMVELAGTVAATQAHTERTEAALARAREAMDKSSAEVAEELEQVIGDVNAAATRPGGTKEAEAHWRVIEERFTKLENDARESRKDLEKRIAARCAQEKVSPEATVQLRPHVEGIMPTHWSTALADLAIEHGVPLPLCITGSSNDEGIEEELRQLRNDVDAIKRAREWTVFKVIALLSVMPAVVLVTIFQWLFGKKGGGGEGKGSGSADARGAGKGEEDTETVGSAPKATKKNEAQTPGKDGAKGSAGSAPRTGPPKPPSKIVHTRHVHANVSEGAGVTLEVRGNALTFIDSDTKERWYATWPPRFEGSEGNIPSFSPEIRLLEANVKRKIVVLDVPMETCGNDKKGRITLGADPKTAAEDGLLVTEAAPNCVW